MPNPCGKTRPVTDPYEIWEGVGRFTDWTWKVLKKYQIDDNKPFARAFCVVTSPYTGSYGDMGDVYIADYARSAIRVHNSLDLPASV